MKIAGLTHSLCATRRSLVLSEYQQGELYGYEVREYLLEKLGHKKCCYCHTENIPLEVEHIIPKSRHGSVRVDNLSVRNTGPGKANAPGCGIGDGNALGGVQPAERNWPAGRMRQRGPNKNEPDQNGFAKGALL